MNILITGSNGQLGTEMRTLAETNAQHRYFFTDVEDLDICNVQAVDGFVNRHKIDLIVNCAAYTAVDAAEENRESNDLLNCIAPGHLAGVAKKYGAALIHISTDYVFDGTGHIPYREDSPTCPATAYGAAKLAGEQLVMERCERAMVIRTSWLYSTSGNNFLKTMLRLQRERDSVGVVFDQIGTPTYAGDLAKAIYTIMEEEFVPGIYHFSNEGVCSWYDFAVAICRLTNADCRVNPIHTADYPAKAARPHYSVLDKAKIKKTFGLRIPHWEDALAGCLSTL
ncbi:MAG: dTDP-4-dehydrorhamnose reductase [Mediterranea sp.]|jgi:dTDP-4-dehydrorhamnose reductase|nr:dTDP-4-dehydrorhamnose reductase [Mediterranea sp.]